MRISEPEFGDRIGKYENVLYLCHRNADPDAIGSAFALQQAFGGTIAAVDDLSRTGEALAKAVGAAIEINPRMEDWDLVVVVDTAVRLQLGDFHLASYAVVDHHLDRGLLEDAGFYIQRPSTSTAEIVWTILKQSGCRASREMALGLLVGLISDTGRFRRASPEAFRTAAELLKEGGLDYEEALQVISVPSDISQRIAVLKAATRAVVDRHGDWLIATTQINSFEGSAAMALVDLGADVAFAAGKHFNLCRISGRAGREAARTGVNLAEILREIARAHGGEGGGHRAAAALEARGEPSALLEECRKKVAERLP
ncbi:manganese-dependent inorganic pyrophosphatase [uncultured archaeon]|nr:manganese-dependent inorganic pyrophosphatase [uncultured archaeon]